MQTERKEHHKLGALGSLPRKSHRRLRLGNKLVGGGIDKILETNPMDEIEDFGEKNNIVEMSLQR